MDIFVLLLILEENLFSFLLLDMILVGAFEVHFLLYILCLKGAGFCHAFSAFGKKCKWLVSYIMIMCIT